STSTSNWRRWKSRPRSNGAASAVAEVAVTPATVPVASTAERISLRNMVFSSLRAGFGSALVREERSDAVALRPGGCSLIRCSSRLVGSRLFQEHLLPLDLDLEDAHLLAPRVEDELHLLGHGLLVEGLQVEPGGNLHHGEVGVRQELDVPDRAAETGH